MDRAIRVLMITCSYPTPESPRRVPFIARQVEYLRRAGVDLDLFHFKGSQNLFNYLKAWRRLREHTAGKTYDLVHAQWGQSAALAMPKRLPLVSTFSGIDLEGIVGEGGKYTLNGRIQQAVSQLMARMADRVIVVSDRLGGRLKRKDYHVIPSGLDFDLFRPIPQGEARELLGLPKDKRLILFAASRKDNPRKRFDLAEAAVELIRDRFNAELIVATKVPHTSIPYYMNACDALLLTSMHEGSPNVVKEALACNLPVVSMDVGDVPARIRGIDGCAICTEYTPRAIASCLEHALSFGKRIEGRRTIEDLDENVITRRVIEIYRSMLVRENIDRPVPEIDTTDEASTPVIGPDSIPALTYSEESK
jgi:glycosyltransferase involved in cell wall biosynthesis